MSTPHHHQRDEFGEPARYRIVVEGQLGESGRRRFTGMTIESTKSEGSPQCTTLVGVVRDQAELRGILDALYGLHLPVISLKKL